MIGGTGFTGATAVDFGTTVATSFTVVSATSITATSPAGTGTVDVTVTAPGGTSPTTPADLFTYVAAPTVTGLSPKAGPAAGGTMVTITGTGFTGASAVDFGTTLATSFSIVSATSITATSPAGSGTVDVTVTTVGGKSATTPADQFSYAPTVSAISPTAGPFAGGTLVTITGTGFIGVTAVDFGTTSAPIVTVSATSITATSPAGTGVVDVTVATTAGTSPTTPADLFTYVAAPTVSGVSPNVGPGAGGTVVTITGTDFSGATAVDFGTTPALSFTVQTATSITATSPPGTGVVDVTVTGSGGTSATSPADQFTYGPKVSAIRPLAGPLGGGTSVTISGTGFTGATAVDFGPTAAQSFTVVSDTSITAVSPAGTGVVNVTVTSPIATSATSAADLFTYGPLVSSISPTSGPATGGTLVTITGLEFTGATAVDFGPTPAESFTVVSSTSITAVSPAGTGTVDVTVTALGATSPTSTADLFTYAPTVTGISPTQGAAGGGTFVTITGTGFAGATAVDFGTTAAAFEIESATLILAESPAGTGVVDVTVTTPAGTSATSPADQFTYLGATTVSAISPNFGPAAGGTLVTITGTGFTGATAVIFGTTAAAFEIESATSILARSPAGTGVVDVTVTTLSGMSATSPADQFTYVPAPTVSGLSRRSGSLVGGTMVTITGMGFTGALAVDFGTTPATGFTFGSDTSITAVSPLLLPGGPINVNVTVTTPGGTSAISLADLFFYSAPGVAVPVVSSISPKFGPTTGGTLVTITGTGFNQNVPTGVFFGPTAATSFNVVSFNTIRAVSPAGTTGAVDVTVITFGGASNSVAADLFTYFIDGPQVTSVQRFGVHSQPTYLVINFNSPLDPSSAQNTSNYRIVGPGNRRIRLSSATYNSATNSVTLLTAARLNLRTTYRLTINGTAPSGLTNPEGMLLDGAGTGQPGSNYVTSITSKNLAGSASQLPTDAVIHATVVRPALVETSRHPVHATLHKAAVDHVLASETVHVPTRRARR